MEYNRNKKYLNINTMAKISLLSVIAFLLMLLEFPLPIFPSFLQIDLSDLPALVGGFALGPIAGVLIELLKNLVHLIRTTTGGVGELANFLIGTALVLPATLVYYKRKSKKSAFLGLLIGIISMTIVGALANYYILIPFYANFMPIDQIVKLGNMVNESIVDVKSLIYLGVVPFNLLKGIVVSFITLLIYKKLSRILHT
jgi:riboflavin transporter FmnP